MALKDRRQLRAVTYIAGDHFDVRGEQTCDFRIRRPIEGHYLLAVLEQAADDVRSDEACPSGYQKTHVAVP